MADGPQNELRGKLLFYKNLEPLTLEKHRALGIREVERPLTFLVGTNVIPINVQEFPMASSSYPVIFLGAEKNPVAVMGPRTGENVFVTDDGEIDREAPLPAYARRYPFAFAGDVGSDRLVLCIDAGAPMIGTGAENPFFNGDQLSQFTLDAVKFCEDFEAMRRATQVFVQRITEFELWETKSVEVRIADPQGGAGEAVHLGDYFAVSEAGLQALDMARVTQLRDEGWLGLIYAHLISLNRWRKILDRAVARDEAGLVRL